MSPCSLLHIHTDRLMSIPWRYKQGTYESYHHSDFCTLLAAFVLSIHRNPPLSWNRIEYINFNLFHDIRQ